MTEITIVATYLRSQVGSWQMYGRLPVCIRRWRAKLDDCLINCQYLNYAWPSRMPILFDTQHRWGEVTYIWKGFLTPFMIAYMGFFTGMRSRVNSQRTSLNETFVAILYITVVRTFVGVYPVVPTEIWFSIEWLQRFGCQYFDFTACLPIQFLPTFRPFFVLVSFFFISFLIWVLHVCIPNRRTLRRRAWLV